LPLNNNLPHISYTKITFFTNNTLISNSLVGKKLLIRDNCVSLYTNKWYNLINLNDTVNFTPYGRYEGIKIIKLYFRINAYGPLWNRQRSFRITNQNQTTNCEIFTDIPFNEKDNITVALSDNSEYLGFINKNGRYFIRIGPNSTDKLGITTTAGGQASAKVYTFKHWYKQDGISYHLEIHMDEDIAPV
jgi:hypothetical protein